MSFSKKCLGGCALLSLLFSTSVFATSSVNSTSSTPTKTVAAVRALTFTFPDGKIAITKPNQAPYCAKKGTCDFLVDCYGNLGAPEKSYETWTCVTKQRGKNDPSGCTGQCHLAPITDKEEAIQKVLNTLATN